MRTSAADDRDDEDIDDSAVLMENRRKLREYLNGCKDSDELSRICASRGIMTVTLDVNEMKDMIEESYVDEWTNVRRRISDALEVSELDTAFVQTPEVMEFRMSDDSLLTDDGGQADKGVHSIPVITNVSEELSRRLFTEIGDDQTPSGPDVMSRSTMAAAARFRRSSLDDSLLEISAPKRIPVGGIVQPTVTLTRPRVGSNIKCEDAEIPLVFPGGNIRDGMAAVTSTVVGGEELRAMMQSMAAMQNAIGAMVCAQERESKKDSTLEAWLKANTTSVQITQFTEFFDGNPEKFAQWLKNFNHFKTSRGLSNPDAFDAITTRLLVGKAKSDFMTKTSTVRTYTTLKTWLIKEYASEEMVSRRKQQILEFRSKMGEGPKSTLKRFLRLKAEHESEVEFIVSHGILTDSMMTRKIADDTLTQKLFTALDLPFAGRVWKKHGKPPKTFDEFVTRIEETLKLDVLPCGGKLPVVEEEALRVQVDASGMTLRDPRKNDSRYQSQRRRGSGRARSGSYVKEDVMRRGNGYIRPGVRNERGKCFRCGEHGHWSNTCKKAVNVMKCYNCGRSGHRQSECRQRRSVNTDAGTKPVVVKRTSGYSNMNRSTRGRFGRWKSGDREQVRVDQVEELPRIRVRYGNESVRMFVSEGDDSYKLRMTSDDADTSATFPSV
jgi:hypothetical protein